MSPVLLALAFAGSIAPAPPADDVLAALCDRAAKCQNVAYSGARQYRVRNERFGKEATVTVRMTSRPGEGKQFTITQRSGAERLIGVVEKLLASESEFSRPGKTDDHEIGPANYNARVRGFETVSGHDCVVLELMPKTKSKYLVEGTAWVDRATYGLVRLQGATAASVSRLVGTPQIAEEFAAVEGVWLPARVRSKSNSFLLGESALDIDYTDYKVENATLTAARY